MKNLFIILTFISLPLLVLTAGSYCENHQENEARCISSDNCCWVREDYAKRTCVYD